MSLTHNETQFIIWACVTMLGIFGFIGVLGVKALIQMASDLNEIKVTVMKIDTKHDELEKRVNKLEEA